MKIVNTFTKCYSIMQVKLEKSSGINVYYKSNMAYVCKDDKSKLFDVMCVENEINNL